jgi:hypothetical protein
VNRRLLVAGILVTALGGGLASSALASETEDRHKICIDHAQLLPNGICIVWDDPRVPPTR